MIRRLRFTLSYAGLSRYIFIYFKFEDNFDHKFSLCLIMTSYFDVLLELSLRIVLSLICDVVRSSELDFIRLRDGFVYFPFR